MEKARTVSSATGSAIPASQVGRMPAKLSRSRDAILAYFRPVLHAYGVTDAQWRVLRALSREGELDATDTARQTFLPPSSLSRILRDLTSRGLIAVRVCPGDARRTLHTLTKAGRKLVADIEPNFAPVYEELERRVGAEPLRQLAEALDRLSDLLEEV
jgi:homoprotocatechuate degradation regulator HpaR